VSEPTTHVEVGSMAPPFRNIAIIMVIILGAWEESYLLPVYWQGTYHGVSHLTMMRRSIHPNRAHKRTIYGKNSKIKSMYLLK